jgi:tryptophan halogenase
MRNLNKIIILGGGTSGLVTALVLQRKFPHLPITVIESSNIGTIGVGEGATEHWKYFCEVIGIRLEDTLVECGATLKAGIKFSNWGVPDYWHATCEPYARAAGDYLAVYAKLISEASSPADIVQKRVVNNTVPLKWAELNEPLPVNQFHFNTFTTNDYLHKLCAERNITVVDDKIIDIELDQDGYITNLVSATTKYSADFFVDSSGFARVLMSKLGAKWESYQDNLWVNSAIAFPTEDTDEYPICTSATGMDYGWMWNTPVKGRWGNGYVFCDKYINFDQAQAEVEKKLGRKVDIAKRIKFDAGKIDRAWIKNCASVGISSSFIEPLESSAISQTILQAFLLMNTLSSWAISPESIETLYNNRVNDICKNILDFVAVHYYVPREDTEFWKDLKENREAWVPDSLKDLLAAWSQRLPLVLEFDQKYVLFTADNWAVTLYGLGLLDAGKIKQSYELLPEDLKKMTDAILEEEQYFEKTLPHIPHKEGLEKFLDNYTKIMKDRYGIN